MKKRLILLLFCLLTLGMASMAGAATTNLAGVIDGDILYKGIQVSRIFDERLEHTVGAPLNSRGSFRFYDGLELYCSSKRNPDNSFTEYVDIIMGTNLSLFEINGVTLNKTRSELLAVFGKPIEYYKYPDYEYRASDDNLLMRYHLSNHIFDYMVDFSFSHPDNKSYIINIKRIGQ